MSTILAVDLGGTRFRAGLATAEDPAAVQPLGDWDAPQSLARFDHMLDGLLSEHRAARLGVSVPGLAGATTCVWIPNLPYLDGVDLATRRPGLTIGLGHDAQLALLAEVEAGCARDMNDAILLAIGTGIGSAVLSGGRIVRGHAGAACSFGWAAADVTDSGSDRFGWLERQASGRALDAIARDRGLANGSALIAAAADGSMAAAAALEVPMTALGTALAGAIALLDPETIILTGGVAAATDIVAAPILAAARRQLPPHLRGIELRAGAFGARASLVGASFAARYGVNWGERRG